VARASGTPQRFPVKTRRSRRGQRSNALLCLQQAGQVYLVQRPDKGVWAGLWSLPEFAALDELATAAQAWPGQGERLPAIEHALTHFDWSLHTLAWELPPAACEAAVGAGLAPDLPGLTLPAGRWVPLAQALVLGLPAPVRRLLERDAT
jgi:A/G-specific adenine glycosylase